MDVQMPSGLIIPSSLKYSLYRMIQDAAISTNVLRLIPLNLQTVKSGGLISVRLPLATCSLPSFSMSFNNYISTYPTYTGLNSSYLALGWDATSATGGYGCCAHAFPQGLEGLIQRLEIVVAGVSLMTLPNYNSLFQVLKDVNQTLDHKVSRNMVEGENDVVPPVDSEVTVPVTCYNWSVTTSGVTMTVNCTASVPFDIPLNGVSWNAPPASFFGFQASVVGASYPTLNRPGPRQFQVSDGGNYNAFNAYTIQLLYTAGTGGVWTAATSGATGGTVNTSTVYSGFPFSFLVTDNAGPRSVQVPNTQANTIRDFLGFFKAMPKAIQLAALGEVEIRIYLEQPNNVIVSTAPPQTLGQMYNTGGAVAPAIQTTSADYTLTNIEFQIRTMSWDNGWLDSQMQAQLADGNTLEIPYPNYYSVVQGNQNGGQTTTRFSVNTQNLRQVWGINKPNLLFTNPVFDQQVYVPAGLGIKYNGQLAPVHKGVFFADSASYPSMWSTLPLDTLWQSYTQSSLATSASTPNKWQFLINNQLIPNLQVPPQRTYAFIQEMLDKEDWEEGTAINNPATFYTGCYAMGITLEYLDKYSDNSIRELFGLDTRSASSVFYLNQTNNRTGDTTYIFSVFTSILRVAMNNQVQVII